jgi:cell division protein FtsB
LFVLYYSFGPCGIFALQELKNVKKTVEQEIKNFMSQNKSLQESIDAHKHDLFWTEKFAREKLAMQKVGEVIYFKK